MAKIEIYPEEWYSCCTTARALLRNKDLGYGEIGVTPDAACEQDMIEHSQRRMAPQIFIDKSAHG